MDIPVLSNLLIDTESLYEYDMQYQTGNLLSIRAKGIDTVFRRTIAIERKSNLARSDSYYNGLIGNYWEHYKQFHELFWKFPYELSKEFLECGQGVWYVKAYRFDDWMSLICKITPSFVIAASFLDTFSDRILTERNGLISFITDKLKQFKYTTLLHPYLPDLNYFIQENGGLNDLHIHLNGSTETDKIWRHIVREPYQTTNSFSKAFYSKDSIRRHSEQIVAKFTPQQLLVWLKIGKELRDCLINGIAKAYYKKKDLEGVTEIPNLWGDFSYNHEQYDLIDEIMLQLLVMDTLRKSQSNKFAAIFHYYLLIKGIIHQFVVMQNTQVGFDQFQLLTDNTFRDGVEEFYKNRFLQLSHGGSTAYLGVIEGRFSPKTSAFKNQQFVAKIVSAFDSAKREEKALANANLSLVAHFIKKPESKKSKLLNIRHRNLRVELKNKAIALNLFAHKSKYGKYVNGIDAAANEMDAGPEVFAQTFRFLRESGFQHFTYHAGEDFRHLISGLRAIVEAVDFLELKQGDRLGHCVAVGISPQLWYQKIGDTCYLSQGEWLDDLVFVWSLIRDSKDEELHKSILTIESAISEYSFKIYGEAFLPFLLAEAWKLRKYDPFIYLENKRTYNSWNAVDSYEDRDAIKTLENNSEIKRLFKKYHEPLDLHDPKCCRASYDKIVSIETCNYLSPIQLMALQNIVLEKLARAGIVIEALPTSNIHISYYDKLNEYHLKRWMVKEDTSCLLPPVVLGTDDPGIFLTNIYNEYARAYLSLESSGYSMRDRLQKLTELQKCSKIYNFYSNGKQQESSSGFSMWSHVESKEKL